MGETEQWGEGLIPGCFFAMADEERGRETKKWRLSTDSIYRRCRFYCPEPWVGSEIFSLSVDSGNDDT